MKKLVSFLMVLALLLGCVSATAEELKPVTIRWYYPAQAQDQGEGSRDVIEAFNKKLATVLPNTTLEVVFVADYEKQLPLLLAGEEPMDIIWEGWSTPFRQDVEDGNLLALDTLVAKYPNLAYDKETFSLEWSSAVLNGETWAVPCVQPAVSDVPALRVDEVLYPYFPVDEFIAESRKSLRWTKEMLLCIDKCIEAALADGAIELGGNWMPNPGTFYKNHIGLNYINVGNNFYYDPAAEKLELMYRTELPEYKMFVEHFASWYDKGWVTDAHILGQGSVENFVAFDVFTTAWTDLIDERGIKLNTYKGRTQYCILMDDEGEGYTVGKNFGGSSTYIAIPYTCKNPERVMMLLNLLYDQPGTVGNDLLNMLCYGFEASSEEAKTYGWANYTAVEKDGQLVVDTSIRNGAATYHSMTNWMICNTYNCMSDGGSTTTAALKAYARNYYENAFNKKIVAATYGMPPINTDAIRLELESLNATATEYDEQMYYGGNGTANYMNVYDAYAAKLQTAGIETIRAHLQAAVDAYINNK